MLPAPDRSHTSRDTTLFLICVIISGAFLFTPPPQADAVATLVRGTVLLPLVELQQRAEEGKTSRSRFRALQAERDSLVTEAQALPVLEAENARLRRLFSLRERLATPFVAAEVLHQAQATDGLTLLLSSGSDDGVAEYQPVIAPEGLVGVTRGVERRASTATTWAHPEFRASAITNDGEVSGIVAPFFQASTGAPLLELRGVPYRDSVQPGTLVLTSGLGGIYPKGIPIGTIAGVARESAGWERVYVVRPMVNPGSVSHVLILTGALRRPVSDAFPPDSGPDD
jgi:rod shape-determining protein MreC